MRKARSNFGILYSLILFLIASCNYGDPRTFDTPTQGTERIGIDQNYFLIFESQIYTFMAQYQDAVIYPNYRTENELFDDLMKDSCDLIVTSRDLTPDEKHYFAQQHKFPKTIVIAEEGIAIIVNRSNSDSVFTMQQIEEILSGRVDNWKNINPNNSLSNLALVIDQKDGANARYLKENYIKSSTFPATITSANSSSELIDYVEKNAGAIGVMSGTWFSDEEDSICQNYLNRIQLVAIKKDEQSEAYRPYQGYIAPRQDIEMLTSKNLLFAKFPAVSSTHDYPLTRKIFMINAEGTTGLATGFVAFVSGEKGQLIILKSGIVPAIVPTRSVKVEP